MSVVVVEGLRLKSFAHSRGSPSLDREVAAVDLKSSQVYSQNTQIPSHLDFVDSSVHADLLLQARLNNVFTAFRPIDDDTVVALANDAVVVVSIVGCMKNNYVFITDLSAINTMRNRTNALQATI